jgi:hypothetical protein
LYRHVKKDNTFEPKKLLGHGTVRKCIQGAYERMGIKNFQTLRSHTLRGEFINRLANDDSVNLSETMAAARHKSATASVAYQTHSTTSDTNRLNALFRKRKSQDTSTETEESRKQNRKSENVVEPEEEPLGSNSIKEIDEEEVVVFDKDEKYSVHTQAAMDGLRKDLGRFESEAQRQNDVSSVGSSTSASTSGNWTWDLPPPPQRSRQPQRYSYPPRRSYSSHRSHPPQQVRQHSRRIPSEREREINALRQRLLMLENEIRMESFPYGSTEQEYEESYNEHIEEHEREMSMRRTRRNRDFHRNSY